MTDAPYDKDLIRDIAIEMARALGRDPHEIHTIGMGEHQRSVPYFEMQEEWAVRFLAGMRVLGRRILPLPPVPVPPSTPSLNHTGEAA